MVALIYIICILVWPWAYILNIFLSTYLSDEQRISFFWPMGLNKFITFFAQNYFLIQRTVSRDFRHFFYHKTLPRPQTVWTDKKVTKNVILYFQKLCVCVVIDYTDTSWNSCWLMRTWCQQIHWPCGRGCWKHWHGVSVVNENEDMVSA